MDINLYVTELRLAELREEAARRRLLQAARATRSPLRVTFGQALIRLGRPLLGGFSVPLSRTRTTLEDLREWQPKRQPARMG